LDGRDRVIENPYESPRKQSLVSGDGKLASARFGSQYVAAELAVIAAACLGAVIAVPLLYQERSGVIWVSSIAVFAGVPLLVGIVCGHTTRFANLTAGLLLLACPLIYLLTDPLPVAWEKARDAAFLATGSIVTFVTAAWSGHFLRARKWILAFAGGLLLVCAAGSVAVMIAVFMYLE
jgi:hypothetical protein